MVPILLDVLASRRDAQSRDTACELMITPPATLSPPSGGTGSRSDTGKVAVGFSPRNAAVLRPRRVATLEKPVPQFMRRSATRLFSISHRGLKPTATVAASLRDAVIVGTRGSSQARNPGLRDGIPLGFSSLHSDRK